MTLFIILNQKTVKWLAWSCIFTPQWGYHWIRNKCITNMTLSLSLALLKQSIAAVFLVLFSKRTKQQQQKQKEENEKFRDNFHTIFFQLKGILEYRSVPTNPNSPVLPPFPTQAQVQDKVCIIINDESRARTQTLVNHKLLKQTSEFITKWYALALFVVVLVWCLLSAN